MTIIPVTFSPATCSCSFNFDWDDVNLVRTFVSVINTCQFHSGLTDVTLFNTAWNDDIRMSDVRQAGINALPAVLSASSVSGGDLITGVAYHYGWTNFQSGRILFVQYAGSGVAPNAVQQITIQSGINGVVAGKAFVVANINGVSGITIVA